MKDQAKQDIASRRRKIDLDAMSDDEVTAMSERIGLKVGAIVGECINKCKEILKIYNLDIKLVYVVHDKGINPDFIDPEMVNVPVTDEELAAEEAAQPVKREFIPVKLELNTPEPQPEESVREIHLEPQEVAELIRKSKAKETKVVEKPKRGRPKKEPVKASKKKSKKS